MKITIDKNSGFCFGVIYAIEMAESILKEQDKLYSLGDIVHNNKEVDRLEKLGLEIITRQQLKELKNTTVLIRAHGEPPETYSIALKNNIKLLDASITVLPNSGIICIPVTTINTLYFFESRVSCINDFNFPKSALVAVMNKIVFNRNLLFLICYLEKDFF